MPTGQSEWIYREIPNHSNLKIRTGEARAQVAIQPRLRNEAQARASFIARGCGGRLLLAGRRFAWRAARG